MHTHISSVRFSFMLQYDFLLEREGGREGREGGREGDGGGGGVETEGEREREERERERERREYTVRLAPC